MKIITFKYNRTASAIYTSTLMANEEYARKDIHRLATRTKGYEYEPEVPTKKSSQEYAISGTWQ